MKSTLTSTLTIAVAAVASLANGAAVQKASADNNSTNAVNATELVEQEIIAVDQVSRIETVANSAGNSSFVFDFLNAPEAAVVAGDAGNITTAVVSSFPALEGTGAAMFLFQLGPCGMVLPHSHPRASEFIVVTEGKISTQFLTETGSDVFSNTLKQYQSTIFPVGSLHVELNPTCEPAKFIGAFDNPDPGTFFVAPGFFSLEEQVVLTQLGGAVSGADLSSFKKAIPPAGVVAIEQCLKNCNITANAKRDILDMLPAK
ncbi:spherulin-1A [Sugiyamaella lignohabitans]|uniref:Spherulin-1A n=1 Tax=Sugiyamaella lignohabitans TaxID=796027 RepID=A0A167FWL8_9ASCO|nr:spherulin-1A [Sugiyamaella lignohabitans]ANB15793.1 spherulin-1A [Sugiyamaella lignohabitans]